ncbi:MAG: substrate-binding domain-containing protein [Lachnospiraceae bacterium]|nr:substrate-binding domain-containing protein [Lachnospiraceae bacterium]
MEDRPVEEIQQNKYKSPKKQSNGLLIVSIMITVVSMVLILFFYRSYMNSFKEDKPLKYYDQYYVMIASDPKSSFMQAVYNGAVTEASESGICIDMLGDELPSDYTKYDLMRIAIDSRVDGIVIDADESEEMTELLDKAAQYDIPVVTLLDDNTKGERCSFVGIGGYDIGKEYGTKAADIIKKLRRDYFMTTDDAKEEDIASIDVAVLVNASEPTTGQNIIISGIKEALAQSNQTGTTANVMLVSVDNSNPFSVEESIRDLFISDDIPRVIVCLDELSTACVYQAVIDYNVVGKVNILGYYYSDVILNAIDRGVIQSTVSVDAAQLGEYCVNALKEYHELGATSQYFTADITFIDRSNVSVYINREETDE